MTDIMTVWREEIKGYFTPSNTDNCIALSDAGHSKIVVTKWEYDEEIGHINFEESPQNVKYSIGFANVDELMALLGSIRMVDENNYPITTAIEPNKHYDYAQMCLFDFIVVVSPERILGGFETEADLLKWKMSQ